MRHNLTSIVAIDQQGAIGCKNHLPWSIKSDLAFFRRTTLGHTVIMGRKTYVSVGGALKGRTNIVLSHNGVLFPSSDTCKLVSSVNEALVTADRLGRTDAFVIGGAATYAEFSEYVDRYLVTVVGCVAPDADAFLDADIMKELSGWDRREIGSFPAEEGRDDFPFQILEYVAPDAAQRREARKGLIDSYLQKAANSKSKRQPTERGQSSLGQEVFAF